MHHLLRFCRSDDEGHALSKQLKLIPCPHCHSVGNLIRHGFLYGFDDSSPRRTVRARRLFCSNRQARRGCGRTFSLWLADKIRRLSLSANTLWRFLQQAVADGLAAALRAATQRCDRTWLRLWQRFHRAQSKIRTALASLCPPPVLAAGPGQPPAEKTSSPISRPPSPTPPVPSPPSNWPCTPSSSKPAPSLPRSLPVTLPPGHAPSPNTLATPLPAGSPDTRPARRAADPRGRASPNCPRSAPRLPGPILPQNANNASCHRQTRPRLVQLDRRPFGYHQHGELL
jgi:hypothetical protein